MNKIVSLNLTIISVCLMTLVFREVPLISVAKAERTQHCTGTIIVNRYGDVEPNIGGYDVDLNCG